MRFCDHGHGHFGQAYEANLYCQGCISNAYETVTELRKLRMIELDCLQAMKPKSTKLLPFRVVRGWEWLTIPYTLCGPRGYSLNSWRYLKIPILPYPVPRTAFTNIIQRQEWMASMVFTILWTNPPICLPEAREPSA